MHDESKKPFIKTEKGFEWITAFFMLPLMPTAFILVENNYSGFLWIIMFIVGFFVSIIASYILTFIIRAFNRDIVIFFTFVIIYLLCILTFSFEHKKHKENIVVKIKSSSINTETSLDTSNSSSKCAGALNFLSNIEKENLARREKVSLGSVNYNWIEGWYYLSYDQQYSLISSIAGAEVCIQGGTPIIRIIYQGEDVAMADGVRGVCVIKSKK